MSQSGPTSQHSATSVLNAFVGVEVIGEPRACIVALARHIATVLGAPAPAALVGDPPTPTPVLAALAELDVDYTVDLLGVVWEQLLGRADKRSQGAHFTPRDVADRIAQIAFEHLSEPSLPGVRIWDPSCGGGAFLLSAARWLDQHTARSRSNIVGALFASDIDPTALDVCDAALEIWSRGEARPHTAAADALLDLPDGWPVDFEVVIGNPPFLSQLAADTTRSEQRRQQLADRFESAKGAYVDEAGLFVELALTRVEVNGVVALIVPESILAARDSLPMRTFAFEHAALAALWLDEGQSFAAAVDVVALVLTPRPHAAANEQTSILVGVDANTDTAGDAVPSAPSPTADSWAPLLASALGVPNVDLGQGEHLGNGATITAGFRQHFYGISDAVVNGEASTEAPKLVTSGAIEPLRSLWGERSVKFAGNKWETPVLDYEAIADEKVASWFRSRQVPKLLLASQTRILEVVVDIDGSMVPSVPVVSVEPDDPERVWHLAAALTAPAVSAWMLSIAAGTGLSHDAIRVRAATLASLPLPSDPVKWDEGARLAQRAYEAASMREYTTYVSALKELAIVMNAAYRVSSTVGSWWWERFRLPAGFEATPRRK